MLGGLALIIAAVYILLGFAVDFLALRISPATEKRFAAYFPKIRTIGTILDKESQSLQVIVNRFKKKCTTLPYDLQVRVVDNEMINALALPGGQIIIFSGLLKAAPSEDELAFVLAHEIGHYANRDHLRGIGRSLILMSFSATLFNSGNFITEKLTRWLQISELAFSRRQESAADEFALNLLSCFQGHAKGAINFFEQTMAMDKKSFAGHYFASHPNHQARIKRLKNLAKKQRIPLEAPNSNEK